MKSQITLFLGLLFSFSVHAQPGTLDDTFGDDSGVQYFNFLSPAEEWMTHTVVDNQDRIWVAGHTFENGDGKILLSRLTPNGDFDSNFGIDGNAVIDIAGNNLETVQGITLHNNGIVLVGQTTANGETFPFVIRYTLSGALDFNFGDSGILSVPVQGVVSDVTTDEDGNIYVSGMVDENVAVFKVLPDGNFDQTFGFFGATLADFPSMDESAALSLDSDGNIYVFGNGFLNGVIRGHITSFLPSGEINTGFTANGRKSFTWPNNKDFNVHDGFLSNDGTRFYLIGETDDDGSLKGAVVAAGFDSDPIPTFAANGYGEYDHSFGNNTLFNSAIEGENGLYISALTEEIPSGINTTIVHIDANGNYVDGFGSLGNGSQTTNLSFGQSDYATDLAFQSNGKLVASGVLFSEAAAVIGFAIRVLTEIDDTAVEENEINLSAYPNPCRDVFWVSAPDLSLNGEAFRIFNLQGQLVQSGIIQSSTQQFNVGHLPAGAYQLLISDRFTGRFIKQ